MREKILMRNIIKRRTVAGQSFLYILCFKKNYDKLFLSYKFLICSFLVSIQQSLKRFLIFYVGFD